ncbi:ATP-binding protein [Hippea maritima]|uniref:AAA-ATPase n=1 Tax=Hippea maritima (strain ATCC 700847 / DSM 10411 / MH2) TaxID=760142 RepID=F2LUL0_HIPMA|nr:ATP-binding protein [Hippea maritima]AEA34600.1 AAA-ATPase [Hippea maritima DSM 10411]
MKRLPIGIQTFSKIIEENCYYVDKTHFALKLIQNGGYYFLSRPRRFGKSLFLDTLAEIFLGNKELFKGLYIYDKYDFKPHPVIRISFGSGDYSLDESQTIDEIKHILQDNIEALGLDCTDINDFKTCFKELIRKSYQKHKTRVVILIDEYDKPILDNITNKEMATKARNILKNFYSIIKDNDRYIRFVFITGVSKFSKLNLFSGLNNLEDITINKEYAEICGYTHDDLLTVFKDRIEGANLELVKKWYNGYNYFGKPLYNPFDILLFLSSGHDFRNYWWQTGNPSFLIEKLKEENYYIPELENALISEEALEAFDVEYIDLRALLWQTGYLTFEERFTDERGRLKYKLKIPNLEIQYSLNELFILYLTNQRQEMYRYEDNLYEALKQNDFTSFTNHLKTIFSTIPYTNYANNIISKYEGYYSSVVFTYLMALGYDVIPEDITNKGRIDLTIKTKDKILIIEFKVDQEKDKPIKQIKERRYYEKYLKENKDIYLVGMVFDSKERNIESWRVEEVNKDGANKLH